MTGHLDANLPSQCHFRCGCVLPQKPDHGHGGVVNHPERMVHLSGLMDVDVGYYPRDRVPLIQGWLSELGFNGVFVNTVRGQARKQRHQTAAAGDKENEKAAPAKRQLTGRYLVTLPSSAEAERLAREIHGRKYAVTSKLVRACLHACMPAFPLGPDPVWKFA